MFVASNLGFLERREEVKKKATTRKLSLTSQSSSNAAVGVASCERVDSVELDDNDVNVIDDENEEVRDPREEEEDIDVRIHINVDEEEENNDEVDAEGLIIELPDLDFNVLDQQLDDSLRNFEGDNFELLSDDDE